MSTKVNTNLYAVGSKSHVTLVDPRSSKRCPSVVSRDRGSGENLLLSVETCTLTGCVVAGIRSIAFNCDILSFGTGTGGIYFFDMRAMKYLEADCKHALMLRSGKGWSAVDVSIFSYLK